MSSEDRKSRVCDWVGDIAGTGSRGDLTGEVRRSESIYKDVMREPSSCRNPPERCPRPLYSRDSTQEDLTVPHQDQDEEPKDIEPEVKEEEDERLGEELRYIKAEFKKEEEEETLVSGAQQSMEEGEINPKSEQVQWSLHMDTNGSRKRNPPERCPRPLDSTQEDLTVPQRSQSGNLGDNNIVVKEEYREEDEEYGLMEDFSEDHADFCKDVMMEPCSSRNPPERCPRPLYSRDPTQEEHNNPRHDQGEEPKDIKVEVKKEEEDTLGEEIEAIKAELKEEEEEETSVSGAQQSMEEGEMNPTWSLLIEPDGDFVWNRYYACSECGKSFDDRGDLVGHQRIHHDGVDFALKGNLLNNQKSQTDKNCFSCSMCGKSFNEKEKLLTHQRSHTGERPFLCSECGKYFVSKARLVYHQKRHTGKCPYPCSECRKCFAQKGDLVKHQRIHTGERPYTCSECGKSFTEKKCLRNHEKLHTGERPYSCSECGKGCINKQRLKIHQMRHTGKRPYWCLECGKGFFSKPPFVEHQKGHTH